MYAEWIPYFFTIKNVTILKKTFPFSYLTQTYLIPEFSLLLLKYLFYTKTPMLAFICCFQCLQYKKIYKQIETNANNVLCSSREYVPAVFL